MNDREKIKKILLHGDTENIPVVNFGFWTETLRKWTREGHIPKGKVLDRPMADIEYDWITKELGFDFNWHIYYGLDQYILNPVFEQKVLETYPDGKQKVFNREGAIVLQKPGVASIPAEIDHVLKDRKSWEENYLPRLQFNNDTIDDAILNKLKAGEQKREKPIAVFCGSIFGRVRNWLGIEGLSYMSVDDEDLLKDIIDTVGNLCYKGVEKALSYGIKFDYGHFWEDMCYNNGPLVSPSLFNELAAPHYSRITGLLKQHGIDLVSVDCDGKIDSLIPTWLEGGIRIMFPIEIGNWDGNILSMRERYGKELLGVGGVDKSIFGKDRKAIDDELERIRRFVDSGGYIPCPDHRIPPDAVWENVQYYCDKFRTIFQS
jgi:uroporphyrinogen decarboxylase